MNKEPNKEPSEEQNKAPNDGEARVLSDDELKGIVGGGFAPAEVHGAWSKEVLLPGTLRPGTLRK